MKDNIKQSEETKIEWRIMGNPVVSCESTTEAILTIHPDGRVTTSPRLKPDEVSALVLDQIKTAWLKDTQATKIRELQDRIKRLEAALSELLMWLGEDISDSNRQLLEDHCRKAKEAKP